MIPNRIKRISQLMMKDISDVLRFEMKDPHIGFVSVTDVEVAADLATAKVFVSVMQDDMKMREDIIARLNKAAGFIRSTIKEKMTIKRVPTLKFILDNSIERGVRICSLIEQVREADKSATGEPNESDAASEEKHE